MQKFPILCDFIGRKVPFDIWVGEPSARLHPLYFQELWLEEARGGKVLPETRESFQKLHQIALENNTSFEDLCVYALKGKNEAEEKKTE